MQMLDAREKTCLHTQQQLLEQFNVCIGVYYTQYSCGPVKFRGDLQTVCLCDFELDEALSSLRNSSRRLLTSDRDELY